MHEAGYVYSTLSGAPSTSHSIIQHLSNLLFGKYSWLLQVGFWPHEELIYLLCIHNLILFILNEKICFHRSKIVPLYYWCMWSWDSPSRSSVRWWAHGWRSFRCELRSLAFCSDDPECSSVWSRHSPRQQSEENMYLMWHKITLKALSSFRVIYYQNINKDLDLYLWLNCQSMARIGNEKHLRCH